MQRIGIRTPTEVPSDMTDEHERFVTLCDADAADCILTALHEQYVHDMKGRLHVIGLDHRDT